MDEQHPSLPTLHRRRPESHKGDYGRVLLVGGSRGMSGAIALAGVAALRSGAGLVTVATAESCQNIVAGFEPSLMTLGMPAAQDGTFSPASTDALLTLAEHATVIGCGPGIGRTEAVFDLVAALYEQLPQAAVFDADALTGLAARNNSLSRASQPRILTPHEGELARLVKKQGKTRDERETHAIELAERYGLVVVLKGHHTLVTDGSQMFHNSTGNAGMATGGCGDVLTGVITALLGQGFGPFEAAQLGVHLHGAAGDIAATEKGETSMIASDIPDALPAAFMHYQQ